MRLVEAVLHCSGVSYFLPPSLRLPLPALQCLLFATDPPTLYWLQALSLILMRWCLRVVEDYAVLLFGSATFKIARLVSSAVLLVHIFACGFYRVKAESAGREALEDFFATRGVSAQVVK